LGELYQRRALARLHQDALQRLREGGEVAELIRALEEELTMVQASIAASRPGQLLWGKDLVGQVLGYAQAAREASRETLGIPTGHKDLDRTLKGLPAGLIILGGAPSIGKTTLAGQWSCNAAKEMPMLYVTFENSPRNLVLKAICRLGGIAPGEVDRGEFDKEKLLEGVRQFSHVAENMAFLEGSRVTTVPYIQARARQAMANRDSKQCLVVVDYLQKMAFGEGYSSLRENVSSLPGHCGS
jgi:replicative DNA helicase